MARSNSLPLEEPFPLLLPPTLDLAPELPEVETVHFEDGVIKIEHSDGSVTIREGTDIPDEDDTGDFDRNLALKMESGDLETIATDLLDGIFRDVESRKEWLETRALGINLLGLRLEKPRADAGSSSAPLEGMSTVRHPLLLEATVHFQATARGELLPASGPVKVRNDATIPPKQTLQDTSAAQELANSLSSKDELAQALETDFNHYLTVVATEYVPDTDRMFFYTGFGGDGFKKVFNCPLRRRMVSESVDAENLIVSNAATDLKNASRVTHKVMMRPSVLRRMQIMGVYREVDLNPPPPPKKTPVDQVNDAIAGINDNYKKPEDRDYEVYECYCELDLDQFAPEQFKGKKLPLPYRVTIERESRQILDIRRNWKEDDEQCCAKQFFVQFPFIRGLGFYGLGYIHLLGNTTNALTASWREIIDAGMFASFPGFIYDKGLGRQLSNQFRVPPGGGVGLDIGAQKRIQDAIMPIPYREAGAGFVAFINHVEEGGRKLAATANIGVGEGKQDAPVGTTLALIEQASKIIDSAHKRLHAAQTEEFLLMKERFKEDPEGFIRHIKKPSIEWKAAQFIEALESCDLVPVSDPNNPTSLHRAAKGMLIKQLQKDSPALYDPVAVDMRVLRIAGVDPQGLFRPTPAEPPPDPRMVAIQEKAKASQMQSANQLMGIRVQAMTKLAELQDRAKDRESKEALEAMKLKLQELEIVEQQIQHANDEEKAYARLMHELNVKAELASQGAQIEAMEAHQKNIREIEKESMDQLRKGAAHEADNARKDAEHQRKLEQQKELNDAKVAAIRAQAKARPKTPKAKKG